MKRFLPFAFKAFALTMLLSAASASAIASEADYKPMIRYDRVWECVDLYDGSFNMFRYLRFDGTEEINGKTWHRIVSFRTALQKYYSDTGTFTYDYDYDIYENEGYLREEDGLVYTLVEISEDSYGNVHGERYISGRPSPDPDYIVRSEISEAVIYNFNCEVGNTYDGISFITGTLQDTNFKVLSENTVMIDGEECRRIEVLPSEFIEWYPEASGYPVIEGIGAVDTGCLNYTELIDHPTKRWYYHYFNRLLDMDGRILYDSDTFSNSAPEWGGFNSVGSLNEGSRMLARDGMVSFGEDGHRNGITVYDMNGRTVASTAGTGRVAMPTAGLAKGVYVAVCTTDGNAADRRKFTVR